MEVQRAWKAVSMGMGGGMRTGMGMGMGMVEGVTMEELLVDRSIDDRRSSSSRREDREFNSSRRSIDIMNPAADELSSEDVVANSSVIVGKSKISRFSASQCNWSIDF